MRDDNAALGQLFERYRAACPEVEPDSLFMPRLWEKIEARQSFGWVFGRLTRLLSAASAAVCLLLLFLNLFAAPHYQPSAPSYTDALMADRSAERTYYTEAIWTAPQTPQAVEAQQH
jgi:hypothetical protein